MKHFQLAFVAKINFLFTDIVYTDLLQTGVLTGNCFFVLSISLVGQCAVGEHHPTDPICESSFWRSFKHIPDHHT